MRRRSERLGCERERWPCLGRSSWNGRSAAGKTQPRQRETAALRITYLPLGPETEKPAKYSSTSFVRSCLPSDRGYMILR